MMKSEAKQTKYKFDGMEFKQVEEDDASDRSKKNPSVTSDADDEEDKLVSGQQLSGSPKDDDVDEPEPEPKPKPKAKTKAKKSKAKKSKPKPAPTIDEDTDEEAEEEPKPKKVKKSKKKPKKSNDVQLVDTGDDDDEEDEKGDDYDIMEAMRIDYCIDEEERRACTEFCEDHHKCRRQSESMQCEGEFQWSLKANFDGKVDEMQNLT